MGQGVHKVNIDLQRRIAQHPKQLGFGFDFGRHQIEDQNPKRSDILRDCARLGDDKDVFAV